ncbi:hypothetical protein Droror1_Dr00000890 [Drosera rotundifolia]
MKLGILSFFLSSASLFASQNPLIRQLSNLSSQFDSFRQIQCRNNPRMNNLSRHNFAAVLHGNSVAGVVVANGVLNFLNIYNILLTVRLVLTWFPSTPPAIVSPFSMICDPYLNIFRGIIPPLGGTLDLSPILAFIALNAFTNVTAALPAELPSGGLLEEDPSQVRIEVQAVSPGYKLSKGEAEMPYDNIFVWNAYLTEVIRSSCKYNIWTVSLVHGHFRQSLTPIFGRDFSVALVSRRSRHFAETRYLKRGVNDKGRVANDVETEQIVLDEDTGSWKGKMSSVVQMRGSIPLFWSQETSRFSPKPDIILQRYDPTYEASRLHFKDLAERYGNPIIVLNLIKVR